jgi:hypothetical protein
LRGSTFRTSTFSRSVRPLSAYFVSSASRISSWIDPVVEMVISRCPFSHFASMYGSSSVSSASAAARGGTFSGSPSAGPPAFSYNGGIYYTIPRRAFQSARKNRTGRGFGAA